MSLLMEEPGERTAPAFSWANVPTAFTHKRAAGEMLLAGSRPIDAETTQYRLKAPIGHPHYRSARVVDSLLVAEWVRQVVTATAHLRFGVPTDWAFVMRRMGVEVVAGALTGRPEATVRVSAVDSRAGRLRALDADLEFRCGGELVGRGFGDLQVMDPSVYRRVRSNAGLSTLRPPAAPEESPVSVMPVTARAWRISYDPHDAFFFDHPLDHVPGMVFYEALRRVALYASGATSGDAVSFDGTFHRYAELHDELHVHVRTVERSGPRSGLGLEVATGSGDLLVSANLVVSASGVPA